MSRENIWKMPLTKNLDVNIEIDILTAGTTSEIVNAILELLLYQRNQIPFIYPTYKSFVTKWTKHDEIGSSVQELNLQRQRDHAKQTKDAISAMRELISETFNQKSIKCLRFLFGSTTFTPKEVYTIHIPTEAISRNHHQIYHRMPQATFNRTLLTLLTCEDLYAIFSNNLCPTNVYLELEILECANAKGGSQAQVFPKDDIGQLPPSCKDIHFYLLHTGAGNLERKSLECCNEMEIFEDLKHLNLNGQQKSGAAKSEALLDRSHESAWWEADVVVRGFKAKLVKGHSIWT